MTVVIPPNVIAAAQASDKATGIPASVTLAQWAVESGWGSKCTGTFNYFGVKALHGQDGAACATHEVVHGQRIATTALFANYLSLEAAFTAHAELLANGAPYADARTRLPNVAKFVNAFAPHYATDPNYATLLLEIINGHDLTRYDA